MTVDRVPDTRSAFLPNSKGRASLHLFERAEHATGYDGTSGIVLLYRCTETGEIRQWGFEYTSSEMMRLGIR